jgi:hypothetical protein
LMIPDSTCAWERILLFCLWLISLQPNVLGFLVLQMTWLHSFLRLNNISVY